MIYNLHYPEFNSQIKSLKFLIYNFFVAGDTSIVFSAFGYITSKSLPIYSSKTLIFSV